MSDTYSDCDICWRPLHDNPERPGQRDWCASCDGDRRYRIVRIYRDIDRRTTMKTGLSLREAQAWCRRTDTSSSTATSAAARGRTALYGPWFDGYQHDDR